jgi:hypothetical protein
LSEHFDERDLNNPLKATDRPWRAAIIVEWHLEEARHFLATEAAPAERREIVALDACLIKRCLNKGVSEVLAGDVGRLGPSATRVAKKRNLALAELAEMNRVQLENQPRPRRTR